MAITNELIAKTTKQRKSPVPQSSDRITQGALNLELKDRVELRNKLSSSIEEELKKMEAELQKAREYLK